MAFLLWNCSRWSDRDRTSSSIAWLTRAISVRWFVNCRLGRRCEWPWPDGGRCYGRSIGAPDIARIASLVDGGRIGFAVRSLDLSRVGVIRPPGVGIFRPLGRAPNAISKRVAEVAILQHEWGSLEAPFWTLARPSDHGTRDRQVRCNMRCGAAGPAWPRRAAGWWQTRGPIRQSPGCW